MQGTSLEERLREYASSTATPRKTNGRGKNSGDRKTKKQSESTTSYLRRTAHEGTQPRMPHQVEETIMDIERIAQSGQRPRLPGRRRDRGTRRKPADAQKQR